MRVDHSEQAFLKGFGARLHEARQLTSLTQIKAAKLAGIKVEVLRAYELASDVEVVPLHHVQKLAQIYDVSVDFLFGLTDGDWELCEEVRQGRDFLAVIEETFLQEQAVVAARMDKQDRQIAVLACAVETLAPAIREIYTAMMRFWELNPCFEDMPAGATVINALDRADAAAHQAVCALVRNKLLPKKALAAYAVDTEIKNVNA